MARTAFAFTTDNQESSYPDSGTINEASEGVGGADRYTKANLLSGSGVFQFPLENDDFNVPFLQFVFLDAFGNVFSQRRAPTIYVRMPNQFNISSFSEYSKTDNIFGAGNTLLRNENNIAIGAAAGKDGFDASMVAKMGLSAAEAFQTAIARALGQVQGFVASGGMNNISQFEFAQRSAINPFSQMLYKGPQHRNYQIPLMMKPRSKTEADNIKKIIHTFKVASSPSVPNVNGTISIPGIVKPIETGVGEGSTFTFGYPHLTQFNIVFKSVENGVQKETKIFRSKPCVINSVAVDYGGQKLNFFEDGNVTETQLTIQLTEITPRTLGDAGSEARSNFTIF